MLWVARWVVICAKSAGFRDLKRPNHSLTKLTEGSDTHSTGGAEEDRTPDLRIANAALSQLSYGPTRIANIAQTMAAR